MISAFRRLFLVTALAAAWVSPAVHAADAVATKDEAVAMVKKAIALAKSQGKDKVLADINAKAAQFVDRDLYVYVADEKGLVLAHAVNPKLVGRDLNQLKDADGKPFVTEIIKIGASGKPGWVEYRWPNPVTKQIDDKVTYVEKADGAIYCAGVYK
jgi:cytochrome c